MGGVDEVALRNESSVWEIYIYRER